MQRPLIEPEEEQEDEGGEQPQGHRMSSTVRRMRTEPVSTSPSRDSRTRSHSEDLWLAWDRELAQQGRATSKESPPAPSPGGVDERARKFQERIRVRRHVKYFDKTVLNYNTEGIIGPGVFLSIFTSASVFGSKILFWDVMLILGLSVALASMLLLTNTDISDDDAVKLKSLVMDFHTLCTFLLGFFCTTAISRWWAIRNDCLGGLWGGIDDLSLLVGSHFGSDSDADREVRERVLRWSVLSHELVYKQARADTDLSDLVDAGLMLPEELELLKPLASKPQVIWAWMCSYFAHLAYGDPAAGGSRLPYPVTVLPQLHEICRHARGAVGMAFAYTDTQIPFRYVHFLSLIIWTHNIVQAVNSAVVVTSTIRAGELLSTVIEAAFLIVYPLVYFGLLQLGAGILNPLRSRRGLDFPQGAFTYYMLAENQAFYTGNTLPKGPPYGKPPVWAARTGGGKQDEGQSL